MQREELLRLTNLTLQYPEKLRDFSLFHKPKFMTAVDKINLIVYKGESLGIVGESGCGKSSTGRMITRLVTPTSGRIHFKGHDIFANDMVDNNHYHKNVQMIFQDPYSSLDPRFTMGKTIMEPMKIWNIGDNTSRRERAMQLITDVGLQEDHFSRYPFEFSGGQRQRIGVARALSLNPELLVCDEPVSALDVSIQAQILNLLQEIQKKYDLTYIFISHNLSVVKHFCDRVAVMYLGQIVELAENDELFDNPTHPYTNMLLQAVMEPDPTVRNNRIPIVGEPPSPFNLPPGCHFQGRCPCVMDICKQTEPPFYSMNGNHLVKCHRK